MKRRVRLIFLIALAGIFAVELGPLLGSPRNGEAFAQPVPTATPTPDFSLSNTKVKITYETFECAETPTFSCLEPGVDTDSYEVNSSFDPSTQVDLDNDMTTNGLAVMFFNDTCDNVVTAIQQGPEAFYYLDTMLSYQAIPGNLVHKTMNSKWTIYSFEGNVPNSLDYAFTGDHLEMNLKLNNNDSSKSQLHIEANADMCNWAQAIYQDRFPAEALTGSDPVAMVFDIGNFNGTAPDASAPDTDYVCVDVTPQYVTRDISSICGNGEEGFFNY